MDFDKQVFKSLFDDIDFKDIKSLQANKNSSNKLQYFFHEFPNLIEKREFINLFSQVKKKNVYIQNFFLKNFF